jgi:arginase
LVGAACGIGSPDERCAEAPAVLRKLGMMQRLNALDRLGVRVIDGGDLRINPQSAPDANPKLRNFATILEFSERLTANLRRVYERGHRPILIGGDHSISMASLSVAAEVVKKKFRKGQGRLGVLWVDAHADINTPQSTMTGNIHGMPLAHLLGDGEPKLKDMLGFGPKLRSDGLVYIGLRDVDPAEQEAIRRHGILAFTIKEIDALGIGEVCRRALHHLAQHSDQFVVSFDLDVVDPRIAPGVGTPVRGGITFREAHLVMEMAAEYAQLLSVEIVEYNPELDINGVTGDIAIGLIESALGKVILPSILSGSAERASIPANY